MANRKLFIGRKVRELRESTHLTQAAFAERLGISASYLNQIEQNSRSVSASVLLALADKFSFDIASISESESDRLLSALSEALADPIFKPYPQNLQDLNGEARDAEYARAGTCFDRLPSGLPAHRRATCLIG